MPKLRRLNGGQVLKILETFGFEIVRVRGSHHILRRTVQIVDDAGNVNEDVQTVNVPVHGSKPLASGMLKRLYRDLSRYLSEQDLEGKFYTD